MHTKGVFTLIGMPYSGSTILSFLLGSHTQIYNGGDLHHLNPARHGRCSMHKSQCPVWTHEALEKAYLAFDEINAWYDVISEITQKPYICDASKQLSFYENALPKCRRNLCLLLLKKHPMRSAASDVYNRIFAKELKLNKLDAIHRYLGNNFAYILDFVDKRLNQFIAHYRDREPLVEKFQKKGRVCKSLYVKYEDLVARPSEVISEILEAFSLTIKEDQLNYTEFEHHPITGNMGPLWKMRQGSERPKGPQKDFRKNYYLREEAGIVLDNKYQELFNRNQLEQIENLDSYKSLLTILDYEPIADS